MKIDLFDYELPDELIARYPAERRSASRLLVLDRRSGAVSHRRFSDLPQLLRAGDLVVANRTRVFPARVFAKKETGGQVELLLLERLEDHGPGERWRTLARGAKKLKIGRSLFARGAALTVEARESEKIVVRIRTDSGEGALDWADRVGELPLPPYLKRPAEAADAERYQTVFARERGSVAAPTAGLHFDEAVIGALREKGIAFETLRLDVGWGTFAPIRTDDIREHQLDAEFYEISSELAAQIAARKKDPRAGRVVAVGTTATRSLEEAFASDPPALSGKAGLYITPGYGFRVVDALVTNFHLPRTSLLVLVSAFAGRERVLAAYREAVRERYRFYSYGDAMLIV